MEKLLKTWACEHWHGPVDISDMVDMSGHSGKVLAFTVSGPDWRKACVIRLAPHGVPHKGSTDVLRQAPLLTALHDAGLRVPAVVDAFDDTRFFDVPYLVMERLPGRPLMMGPDAGEPWLPDVDRQHAHELAAEQLARLHLFDIDRYLPDWGEARSPREEMVFWADILARGKDDGWLARGMEIHDRLLQGLPEDYRAGLVHGDYQTNNILYTGEGESLAVTGIVDWEIANPGATELDLAWFLMMNDGQAWHPVEQRGGLDLPALVVCYERALGRRVSHLNWFWALACFRFAAIAALNIRLHRTGRKEDAAWERVAMTMPIMFSRASSLLDTLT